ncbi:MAG TPA: cupin domain-containing protein [Myxococcota bacterium]|nr:cupin domain-containing protein [Myxococcota bacterium]
MSDSPTPFAIPAKNAPPRARQTNYPEPFASRMAGREKRPLGDLFALQNFGVNLTRLSPGARSALHHRHSLQDEFIYVLEGEPSLVCDGQASVLRPGMCAGFPANGPAHHLENRSGGDVLYLEVGDRRPGDEVTYPVDDLRAVLGADGRWRFVHKDGTGY